MGQSNYQSGHDAEKIAAAYLEVRGYRIKDINWRTPVCEIDIVVEKGNTIYFVEVKYRSTDGQGGGFDYITPKKLEQMRFSAECWVQAMRYSGDYDLSVIELSRNFQITDFIESID